MKVYVVEECESWEGCSVEEIFSNENDAIEYVKQNYKEFPNMEIIEPREDNFTERRTVTFRKHDDDYYRFVDIEEWEVK